MKTLILACAGFALILLPSMWQLDGWPGRLPFVAVGMLMVAVAYLLATQPWRSPR